MSNLLWPGEQRAEGVMTDAAMIDAMVAVESAWLTALADAGVAPPECLRADLAALLGAGDVDLLANTAEDGGNPAIGLAGLLRKRAAAEVSGWIHRGLTSQDVVDSALMLTLRAAVDGLISILSEQISALSQLVVTYRETAMVARTLTQYAVPTTFGAKAAGWLDGVLNAQEGLTAITTPIQIGGAAGTRSAIVELATLSGFADPPGVCQRVVRHAAQALGLSDRRPWHTTRTPVTAAADALVSCIDAWGRIASDVVILARPEIGELSEPDGRGGSSTIPDKHNPVLSILIRRAAVAAPPLVATLHTAAALANDERPDGAWHAEWDTLRVLVRRTVVAGSQCRDLLAGLQVHPARMAEHLGAADALAEQRAIADFVGKPPSSDYFGEIDALIESTLRRSRQELDGTA